MPMCNSLSLNRFDFLCALFVFWILLSGSLSAASFDCEKASTETEIALCKNFDLSVDDKIIDLLYQKHLLWRKGRDA